MFYIATVHFKTDKWIPIQLRYVKHYATQAHKIYACLPTTSEYEKSFDFSSDYDTSNTGSQNHADKLNFLAERICQEAAPHDIMIFLDGDAFPIADYMTFVLNKLKEYPLIAIRRDENVGDRHPHPSFCAMTVKFWQEIQGDWSIGYQWKNNNGEWVTDSGANLLEKLEKNQCNWYPMLRNNKINLHPLWFGIYEGLVYHHGAGYRTPISRVDLLQHKDGDFFGTDQHKKNIELHNEVFDEILKNEFFYKKFI